jgi:hypothetical protein
MAVGIITAGVARYRRRHRRKLCCGDYNPAHVASGRLQGFPVKGAFASAETTPPRGGYNELRHSVCAYVLLRQQRLLELRRRPVAER